MKNKVLRKLVCFIAACCMICGSVMPVGAVEPFEVIGEVAPSETDYSVTLNNLYNGFMSNKKKVDLSVGNRFYMTYTVDKVEKNALLQNGLIIAQDKNAEWPYEQGTMQYDFSADMLFEEGYTYFYRVEVTEEGFDYLVAKVSEKDSCWLEFPLSYGEVNQDCGYFGIWMGGNAPDGITVSLSAVLCYDAKGNDLGVAVHSTGGGGRVYDPGTLKSIDSGHYYEFSLVDAGEVAISNAKETEDSVVYMSYSVENVKKNMATQVGIAYSTNPQHSHPHSSGILNYDNCEKTGSPLIQEGAEYLIRMERTEDSIEVLVKQELNGEESIYSFPIYWGEFNKEATYFSLWIGEGLDRQVTADFKNFRIYDSNGRNLGVQINKDINITHYGNLEDYTYCEAVYYCKNNDTLLILDDECNVGKVLDEVGAETKWGTYYVNGVTLATNIDSNVETYEYYYAYMVDTQENRYDRLGDTKVEFVTGVKEHEGNQIVNVTAEDGYKVAKPVNPVVDGYTFTSWCLNDGTEYDFDNIVTESITLYAKYEDGNGNEYLSVDGEINNQGLLKTVITVGGCILLAGVTVALIVLMVRKGKNDE